MKHIIRETRSICPICRKNLSAVLIKDEQGRVFLERSCPEHGIFSSLIWQGKMGFEYWTLGAEPLTEGSGEHCPGNCGLCPEHEEGTCCILLEVTNRCNLHCRYCFADGGSDAYADPSTEECKRSITDIVRHCGQPLLQLSGGEPTLRDDLPELVRFAKEAGCSYVQLNTNGLRLAEDPKYVKALADAGLDIVFLQFDGTKNEIYESLRGKMLFESKSGTQNLESPKSESSKSTGLLDIKLEAIRVCSENQIGVTLVPTVVRGVNDDNLGDLVRLACSLAPGVRGIHFQPVSYFGRIPEGTSLDRYTLDDLMADLCDQAKIAPESFLPSRCDHPLCGFHSSFLIDPNGGLRPLSSITHSSRTRSCAKENREYVARHWTRQKEDSADIGSFAETMDFDAFLHYLRHGSLTLSAMAFQDASNLNIERLHRCSLHVYDHGRIVPFCSKYL